MSRPGPDDDHLRKALQDTADAYEPDRAAIARRVNQARAGERAARWPRGFYPVAAALAVVVVVVISVLTVRTTGKVTTPPVAAPISRTTTPWPRPATKAPSAAATVTTPGTTRVCRGPGFVTADGGIDPHSGPAWTQNTVTLTNTESLSSLHVTITVQRTPGCTYAGRYTTVANNDVEMTVSDSSSAMTYAFTLKQGTTLAPGRYLFAAQFDHRGSRKTTIDSYAVSAAASIGADDLSGRFD